MTTRQYRQLERPYGQPLGIQLIAALEGAGTDPFTAAEAARSGAGLGLSERHTALLLHRLAAGGRITRVKKGVYAINDLVTRLPRAHPFAIGTALVEPSAVSHWSALQHWGLTEQVPAAVMLSSPRRTFPPTASGGRGRPAWIVAGGRYEAIAIARSRFFGITDAWVNERDRIPIFDRERALLDAFHHFHVFGSLSVALEILNLHLPDIDVGRLVQYAQQLNIGAVVKRVGWTLDRLGASSRTLAPLRARQTKGDAPLDPGLPARGRHDPKWRVIENLSVA